jgi:hypothetical protein
MFSKLFDFYKYEKNAIDKTFYKFLQHQLIFMPYESLLISYSVNNTTTILILLTKVTLKIWML